MFLPPFLFLFFLLFSKHFETETADFFLSEKKILPFIIPQK